MGTACILAATTSLPTTRPNTATCGASRRASWCPGKSARGRWPGPCEATQRGSSRGPSAVASTKAGRHREEAASACGHGVRLGQQHAGSKPEERVLPPPSSRYPRPLPPCSGHTERCRPRP